MWMKQLFLGFIGLASGLAISAGVFSFIISIGVVPRIIGKSRTALDIIAYENMVLLGGTFGNVVSLFTPGIPGGIWVIIVFGLSAGIFTGCLAVALAEILNTFPIMFRSSTALSCPPALWRSACCATTGRWPLPPCGYCLLRW